MIYWLQVSKLVLKNTGPMLTSELFVYLEILKLAGRQTLDGPGSWDGKP